MNTEPVPVKQKEAHSNGGLGIISDGSGQSPNQAKNTGDTAKPVTSAEELEQQETAKARENEKYVGG